MSAGGSIGTVRITTVTFLESEIDPDAGIPASAYSDPDEEEFQCETVDDAVRHIQEYGLTFEATGNDWAAHPDGSTIVNHATGERQEVTAHLSLFSPFHEAAIIEAVG